MNLFNSIYENLVKKLFPKLITNVTSS